MKISIVIPIYNADQVLEKCITRVLNQSYENIEIILVNDGSTDKSLDICKKFSKVDSRIKLINKENGGVAKARNDGLSLATGDYIYFVDPDDYTESNLFDFMSKFLLQNPCDIVVFGHEKRINNNGTILKKTCIPGKFKAVNTEDKKKFLTNMYLSGSGFSAWDKFISRSFLIENDLKFPLLKRGQDMAFCANCFEKAKVVCGINEIFYHYESFCATGNSRLDPDIVKNHIYIFKQMCKIFCDKLIDFNQNEFLKFIFLQWFAYVVPNNIINNVHISSKTEINKMYNDTDFDLILRNFKYSKNNNLKLNIMLFVLKTRSYYFLKLFVLLVNRFKYLLGTYKK